MRVITLIFLFNLISSQLFPSENYADRYTDIYEKPVHLNKGTRLSYDQNVMDSNAKDYLTLNHKGSPIKTENKYYSYFDIHSSNKANVPSGTEDIAIKDDDLDKKTIKVYDSDGKIKYYEVNVPFPAYSNPKVYDFYDKSIKNLEDLKKDIEQEQELRRASYNRKFSNTDPNLYSPYRKSEGQYVCEDCYQNRFGRVHGLNKSINQSLDVSSPQISRAMQQLQSVPYSARIALIAQLEKSARNAPGSVPIKPLLKTIEQMSIYKDKIKDWNKITIIDFSKGCNEDRLFVIDTRKNSVFKDKVAHGSGAKKGLGTTNPCPYPPRFFSHFGGSNLSSPGPYIVEGREFASGAKYKDRVRLRGLSENFRVKSRAIIMHPTGKNGAGINRTWGCPAMLPETYNKLAKEYGREQFMFMYAPEDAVYVNKSGNPKVNGRSMFNQGFDAFNPRSRNL